MTVEVFLTSYNLAEEDVKDHTVVVIDVLRAASTIATALHHGARAVVAVPDMAEAGKIASNLDQSSYLLGGERDAEKIEGYHLGNSPLEYTPEAVSGRTIILNTTNGTNAIAKARAARHLLIGSFLNAGRVVDFVKQAGLDVTIVCAGRRNRVSLEDTLCAGMMLSRLWDGKEPGLRSDTAHIAFTQYQTDKDHLEREILRCNHAQGLREKGYEADVDYCLQVDGLPVLPYFRENQLVLLDESELASVL
ncbi:MAG: 2-phosphosulfolactate phosphatase [Bacteroidetes bacterium]|jgi:2-phosphosulfolactate phosphatase|nr:2-phosphosulfolactate phosphatase [Bacteroidota bacterium]